MKDNTSSCPILFVDGGYIQSLLELTQKTLELTQKTKAIGSRYESPLFLDLKEAYYNGSLVEWLREGDEKEKSISQRLSELEENLTDNRLLEQFIDIFTGTNYHVTKPDYKDVFEIAEVTCIVNGTRLKVSKGDEVQIDTTTAAVEISVEISVKKQQNFKYRISIEGNDVVLGEQELHLKTLRNREVLTFPLSIPKKQKSTQVMVFVDDVLCYNFKLVRDCEKFTGDFKKKAIEQIERCAPERTKQMLKKFVESLQFIDIDNEFFFLTPLINSYQFWLLTGDIDFVECGGEFAAIDVDQILVFVKRLKRYTGLNFRLPSEVQWRRLKDMAKIFPSDKDGRGEWIRTNEEKEPFVIDSNGHFVSVLSKRYKFRMVWFPE